MDTYMKRPDGVLVMREYKGLPLMTISQLDAFRDAVRLLSEATNVDQMEILEHLGKFVTNNEFEAIRGDIKADYL